MRLTHLLTLLTFSILAQPSLVIYQPQNIAANNPQEFSYTIANFGHIPYGKTMIGKLTLSNPSNLC